MDYFSLEGEYGIICGMQNPDETMPTQPQGDDDPDFLAETRQTQTTQDSAPAPETAAPKKRSVWLRRVLVGMGLFIIIVLTGVFAGFRLGEGDRIAYQEQIVGTEIADQFILGLIDMENGQFENALVRFEYILELDPSHPGAVEQLTKALIALSQQDAVPTPKPAAAATSTPDTRNRDQLYQDALALLAAQDWDTLLATLDSLRQADSNYEAVAVDGMYYIAYRSRGADRILKERNLEGGIFDINRAEKFGPIDVDARSYRHWAELYITGASFWEINWAEAMNYFSQVANLAPSIMDSSGMTAKVRLATAQANYAKGILDRARREYDRGDWCDAYYYYNEATPYVQLGPQDAEKYLVAKNNCLGIPPTAAPTEEGASPTAEPTATP